MNIGRGGALTALALLIVLGCGGSDAKVDEGGGGDGDAGTVTVQLPDGGTIEAPAPPAPPPLGGTPLEGVFVSTTKGIEGADGAMTRPVKTLAEAMKLAQERKTPVNACAETYSEAVKLIDGVTMRGYFDCSDINKWTRIDSARAIIASPTSPAVLAENLLLPAKFEGFEVNAPDILDPPTANQPARSSYGMIVRNTKNLEIMDSVIRGGQGQDGANGAEPAAGNTETGGATEGGPAGFQKECNLSEITCTVLKRVNGAAGGKSKCAAGANGGPGGNGGDGPFWENSLAREGIGTSAYGRAYPVAEPLTAAGAPPSTSSANIRGSKGQRGSPGPIGSNGNWTFTLADGFVPGEGTAGGIGGPGQGGGGGGGTTIWFASPDVAGSVPTGRRMGATGAGGGAGGCGGVPGTAGRGGGASIGLLLTAFENVQLVRTRIESKKGGRAGKGALGTLGGPGGLGGLGKSPALPVITGTSGGDGGPGGAAGLSGHGAPGPSIALVYSGVKPHSVQLDLVPGTPGDGLASVEREGQTLPAITGVAKTEHGF